MSKMDDMVMYVLGYLAGKKKGGGKVIQPLSVTKNGEYEAPEGVDGFNPVSVNVPDYGGRDPRLLALERARELGRVPCSNGWEIRVRTSDELNGYQVSRGTTSGRSHYIYCQLVAWYCYYKYGKFMFAICGNGHLTNIIGDYIINSTDGVIYKYYDRIAVITDDVNLTVENGQIILYMSLDETDHYYNSDGSIDSQSEKTYTITWRQNIKPFSGYIIHERSNFAILRKDHQTYVNDVLDFCELSL